MHSSIADIPVIPDLEEVQEEDMATQIAAPPRSGNNGSYWGRCRILLLEVQI